MKKPYTKKEAKEEITKLVEQFQADFHDVKNPQMKEAQLEDKYIKPLFSLLNWNIHTTGINKGMEEFRVQTSQRIKKSTKQPDYELWLPEKDNHAQMKRHLFMEAKDPKYDLQKSVQWMRQAYQYAHSTLSLSERSNKRTNLSILTDFEEFRLFDCRDPYPLTKNDASLYNKYVIKKFDLRYTEYIDKFDLFWDTFERNNVQNGSLSKFEITDKELKKNRIAPDLKFLDDLKQWRLDFARSMYKSNKSVSNEHLTSATQILINRIIFLKMLTDREIEDDYLTKILERIENEKEEISIYDSCRDIFQELNRKYNGAIFHRKTDLDDVKVENNVFKKILKSLQPEKSVYTLNAMPVEIIGNAYEQFLGDIIVHKGRGIAAEPKPEVRKAGGVYYTPKYIVDYIVQNTVGEKLKKCKSPKDVEKIKIVDPACGSGSFLLGAYDVLVEWHLNYFQHQVDNLLKKGKTLKEINKKYIVDVKCYPIDNDNSDKYSLHLTSKLKKQILTNNLFGVDIDNNAVEITKFSLSMKALEDTTHAELYEDLDLFHQTLLPELKDNIKCGNSLIGNDYFDGLIRPTTEELNKINPFDWKEEDGFKDIFTNKGGFNCVISNPPYVDLKGFPEKELNYIVKSYECANNRVNLFATFIEKSFSLLHKSDGIFSMIVPTAVLAQMSYTALRKKIQDEATLIDLARLPNESFGSVAGEVKVDTLVVTWSYPHKSTVPTNLIAYRGYERISSIDPLTAHIQGNLSITKVSKAPDYIWPVNTTDMQNTINEKLEIKGVPLETLVKFCLGLTPYDKYKGHTEEQIKEKSFHSDHQKDSTYRKLLKGNDVRRYQVSWNGEVWISYGDWLGAPREERFFTEKRILVKQIIDWSSLRIWATLTSDNLYNTQNAFNLLCNDKTSLEYILGLINSKLINFYHKKRFLDEFKMRFQKILIRDCKRFPIYPIDFTNSYDVSSHDRMVDHVDTMLELNKKLPKMKTEHEKTVIQRQIDATDKKIDQLVYKLYDLTEKEIAIVEENVR